MREREYGNESEAVTHVLIFIVAVLVLLTAVNWIFRTNIKPGGS